MSFFSSGQRREGARNMKYKAPLVAVIFSMTSFYRDGGDSPLDTPTPLHPHLTFLSPPLFHSPNCFLPSLLYNFSRDIQIPLYLQTLTNNSWSSGDSLDISENAARYFPMVSGYCMFSSSIAVFLFCFTSIDGCFSSFYKHLYHQ